MYQLGTLLLKAIICLQVVLNVFLWSFQTADSHHTDSKHISSIHDANSKEFYCIGVGVDGNGQLKEINRQYVVPMYMRTSEVLNHKDSWNAKIGQGNKVVFETEYFACDLLDTPRFLKNKLFMNIDDTYINGERNAGAVRWDRGISSNPQEGEEEGWTHFNVIDVGLDRVLTLDRAWEDYYSLINHEFGHLLGMADPDKNNPQCTDNNSVMHYYRPCTTFHSFPTNDDLATAIHVVNKAIAPGFAATGAAGYPSIQQGDKVDIQLFMSTVQSPVLAGTVGSFNITVYNGGPNTAHNVSIYNGAPQGSKLLKVYGTGGTSASCPPAVLVVCNVGTLTSGQNKSIRVDVLVDSNQMAPITHQARARADEGDSKISNNGSDQTQDLHVTPAPDLSVSMSSSHAQAGIAQEVTYAIGTYSNGAIGVSNAMMRFTVPNGMTYVSTTGQNCSYNTSSHVLECWLGAFSNAGPSMNVVVQPDQGGAFRPSVLVFATEPDRDTANNRAEHTLQAAPGVNLGLSQAASGSSVTVGEQVTYSITIANSAQAIQSATNVDLKATLQKGTLFQSVQGAACTAQQGQVVHCNPGSIGVGQSKIVIISAILGPIGGVTHEFSVSSKEADSNTADNSASVTTSVVQRVCTVRPNIRFAVSPAGPNAVYVDVYPPVTGSMPANQVSVIRFGTPNPLVNAVIDVNGMANMSGAFATTFDRSTQPTSARFTARRVTSGQAIMVPFTVDDECGSWPTFVGAGTNAWASAWGSSISVSPVSAPSAPRVGTNMTYTVQAKNAGIHNADTVTVVNTIPEGTTLVSATPSQGACDQVATPGGTFTCAVGQLDPGTTATVTFTVSPTTAGETANWSYATSGIYDMPGQDSLVMPTYINPAVGAPSALPGDRPVPTQTGVPAPFPGTRPNGPTPGVPASLPGSR